MPVAPRPVRRHARRAVLPVALAFLAAACGSGASASGGVIVVNGSSTVEPITALVAERFDERHPEYDVAVDGVGTGDGFVLFCEGEIDINDASSKIKPQQEEACAEEGVEFIELQVGNDGLSVMTNPANDDVECLNFGDLYALTGPESQGVDNWSDARELAGELGSDTDLPDARLEVVGPGEESGTFASYVEIVIEEFNEDRGEEATTRPDYQASADDNTIIQGVQGSESSLGWAGFAYAEQADGVKILEVDGGDGCVAPTPATIADGSYPISRPLFIYVNRARAEEHPGLADFVDFYLGEGIDSVSEAGYVELTGPDLEATRSVWEARTTGPQ